MTCFSLLFEKCKDSESQIVGSNEVVHRRPKVKIYSYKELRKATNDFSPINKIGVGGFGSVYKGKLKDGKIVAIKVLSPESKQGVGEFLNELRAISNITHQNLVTLYGCCAEGNHRILVYNYLENNSLAQTLLGGKNPCIQFNWKTRVQICIGIARGLAYLHEEVHPHIVHRDIKASNILLDSDLTPKISDFGLAKLLPPNTTHVSTRVAGTVGYVAPEYALRGQVTRKSDIYSFGVLLLEIVSGRSNTNTRLPFEDRYLLDRTWSLFQRGSLQKLIDASLDSDLDIEEACKFLKISLLCTQVSATHRPPMSSIVEMLSGRKEVNLDGISKPGLVTDFLELKVNQKVPEASLTSVSSSVLMDSSPISSDASMQVSVAFTTITGRE